MLEYEVEVMGKTEMGLWLSFDELDEDTFIPDSQISDDSNIYMKSDIGDIDTIIITNWIAKQKGLV